MENNNLLSNPVPELSDYERKLATMIMEIRNFMGLAGSQPGQLLQLQGMSNVQQLSLTGKPYRNADNLDYLLAISG